MSIRYEVLFTDMYIGIDSLPKALYSSSPPRHLPKRISLPILIISRRCPENIRRHVVAIRTSCMRESSHTPYHGVKESSDDTVDSSGGGSDVVSANVVAYLVME